MSILAIVAVITLLISVNAFYVGAEFATVSARRTRLRQMAGGGDWLALQLLPIVEDSHKLDNFVAACQLGITISSLALGAFSEREITPRLELIGVASGLASTGVLLLLTTLQVILGELFPKSIAVQYPERLALTFALPVRWTMILLTPLIWLFNGSGRLILRLMGRQRVDAHLHIRSPEEIEILVSESHEGGLLDDEERKLLRNAFRMADLTARQVMVPRTRIAAAPTDMELLPFIRFSIESGFTRILIYDGTLDRILGFIHIKDAFRQLANGQKSLDPSLIREVLYVPEALPVLDVWGRLNAQGQYVAVVFDEYGGTAGMITFEDLIEEIFGELQDEFDEDEAALVSIDKEGRLHLRADVLVTDVNEYLDLELPEDSADTLGGLVFSALGRIPSVGDVVTFNTIAIRVEQLDDLSVSEVSLPVGPNFNLLKATEWEVKRD